MFATGSPTGSQSRPRRQPRKLCMGALLDQLHQLQTTHEVRKEDEDDDEEEEEGGLLKRKEIQTSALETKVP